MADNSNIGEMAVQYDFAPRLYGLGFFFNYNGLLFLVIVKYLQKSPCVLSYILVRVGAIRRSPGRMGYRWSIMATF
jgi:hypothetical protein